MAFEENPKYMAILINKKHVSYSAFGDGLLFSTQLREENICTEMNLWIEDYQIPL